MLPTKCRITHPHYQWAVIWTDPLKRERTGRARRVVKYFKEETDAETALREIERRILVGGVRAADFSDSERADYATARSVLDAALVKLSLAEVARAYVAAHPATGGARKSIQELCAEFLREKEHSEGMADRTLGNLKHRVTAWIDREQIFTAAEVTRERCLALRERAGVSSTTRKNDMNAVSSFLTWLWRNQWIERQWLQGQRRPRAQVNSRPTVWHEPEVTALLEATANYRGGRHLTGMVALLFAGLRPSEVNDARLIGGKQIRVEGGKMRGRANRIVNLSPAARQWLERSGVQAGRIEPVTVKARQRITEEAGVPWVQDAARHTWISARLALTDDETGTAREAGTSPNVIFRHYHGLMTKQEAAAILGIKRSRGAKSA